MEGPGLDRDSRGIRIASPFESPGLRRQRVGDQRGHHQRHGRLDRDRPSLRRDRRPARHDALQRDAPPRRAVRSDLRMRPGRHGVRHGAGTPLVATLAPPRTAPAVTWEISDGIATVVLDLKGQAVNVISRAVKDEFLACFAALADDPSVRAVAGARAALDMILAGKSERAAKAFRLGMVDELVAPPILAEITLGAAKRLAGGWRPKRKRRGGLLGFLRDGNPLGRRLVFWMARKQVLERTGGNYPAPLAALEAVEYGLRHGLNEGLRREAQLFGQLAVTDVSRKL